MFIFNHLNMIPVLWAAGCAGAAPRRLPALLRCAARRGWNPAAWLAVLLFAFVTPAMAATCTTATTGGNWGTAGNWTCTAGGNHVPLAADDVVINRNFTVNVATAAVASVTMTAGTLTQSSALNTAVGGPLIISGGTFNSTNNMTIGGATTLSGGTFNPTSTNTRIFTGLVTISGGTWTGTTRAATFRGGITYSSGTFTAGTGVHTFDSIDQAITGTVAIPSVTITGVTLTNNGTFTIATTVAGAGTLLNAGTLIVGDAAFAAATVLDASTPGNTVNYNRAGTQTLEPVAYQNLILSGTSAKTMTGITSIGGDLTVSGSATTTLNAGFTVTGNLNYDSSGTSTLTAATPISIGKFDQTAGTFTSNSNTITVTGTGANTWNRAGGTFTSTGSTVIFTGAAPQIGASNFNNLTINVGAGNTATLTGNATPSGNLAVSSGTFDLATFTANRTAAGGTITVSNAARLLIGSTNSFPTNYTTHTLGASSTIEYGGTAQTVTVETYGHLTLSGSGNKTMGTAAGQTITIVGNLSVNGGTYLGTTRNPVVNLAGNFTNSSTFTSGSGLFTFNGTSAQILDGTATATAFVNLALNNTAAIATRTLTLSHDVSVSNQLTLTAGRIITGANKVTITNGSAIVSAGTNNFIDGNLEKPFSGANLSRTFEVGSGTADYAPVDIAFASVATAGSIIVKTTSGDHPVIGDSGLNDLNTANRYWTLVNNGVGSASTYSATFNYQAADLDPSATPLAFIAQRYSPAYPDTNGVWNPTTTGALTATSAQVTTLGITDFGDFQLGTAAAAIGGLGRFNAFETDTPSGNTLGIIKTKVAGTTGFAESTIALDIIALTNGGNINTSYNRTVTVDLYDSSTSTGTLDSRGCDTGWTFIQTINNSFSFNSSDNGRKTINFAVAEAYPNVRLRIQQNNVVYGCSTDAFAIRPYMFANFAVTDGTSQTPGTTRTLNDTTFGTVTHKAGRPFTIRATAINRAGAVTTNYAGTPNLLPNPCVVAGVACTATQGAISATPTFTAGQLAYLGVSGEASEATYSEVGALSLQLSDLSYASIDAFTTAAEREIASPVTDVGRFVPDHFIVTPGTLTNRQGLSCASTFTYEGEPLRVSFMLTARNGLSSPTITTNYTTTGGVARLNGTLYANFGFGAVDLADATPPLFATALTARVASGTSSGTWAAGVGSFTVDVAVSRAAAPDGPFESIRLGILPVDADGITIRTADLDLDTDVPSNGNDRILLGNSKVRFGRLRLGAASGSPLQKLRVPVEAQYWNGTFFTTNADDSCTNLATTDIGLGNYVRNPPSGTGTVSVDTVTSPLASGRGAITLNVAPADVRSVDVTVNLGAGATADACPAFAPAATASNKSYLRGNWCNPPGTHTKDPGTRARFGIRRGSDETIYLRENY